MWCRAAAGRTGCAGTGPALDEDVARLARFPPPALRLVIATRADPTIGLGRLRLDGRLTEVRAAELAFSLDEAGQLFEALGIELGPADIETLWHRTEGWAAALRMAALSVQRHPDPHAFIEQFAGTDATISDYLVQEVLARQPPQLRAFLLRTSVVDTLSAELADALTGTSGGHVSLAHLERGGVLTTPLMHSFAAFQDQTGIPSESLGKAMQRIAERDGEGSGAGCGCETAVAAR